MSKCVAILPINLKGVRPLVYEAFAAVLPRGFDLQRIEFDAQAAASANERGHQLTRGTLRSAVHNGKLKANKVGRDWLTTEDAIAEYLETYKPKPRK